MKDLKVSYIWGHEDYRELLIPKIIKSHFNFNIIWTTPSNCDLLLIGTYRKFAKILKKIYQKFDFLSGEMFVNFERGLSFRKNKPVTVFYCRENERNTFEKTDFSIGSDFNYEEDENYLRIPTWKDYCDWTDYGLESSTLQSLNSLRYGEHYSITSMLEPMNQGSTNKNTNLCCFFSNLNFTRNQYLTLIKKHFKIDGYGPAFDLNILDHNHSNFSKKNIMKDYLINFCPENELHPGWYTEKVPDAFLGGNIPLTWADQNIRSDFNVKAMINLNDYKINELDNLFEELKSYEFIKGFFKEPLLLNNINIEQEIVFCKKILKNFN
jgi:hypothetical protein